MKSLEEKGSKEELIRLIKIYKGLDGLADYLDEVGFHLYENDYICDAMDFLREEIAEYSIDYSLFRIHPVESIINECAAYNYNWLDDMISEILDGDGSIEDIADEVIKGADFTETIENLTPKGDRGLARFELKRLEKVNEDIIIFEKLVEGETGTKKDMTLSLIDALKREQKRHIRILEQEYGKEYPYIEKYMHRAGNQFKSGLRKSK